MQGIEILLIIAAFSLGVAAGCKYSLGLMKPKIKELEQDIAEFREILHSHGIYR